MDGGATALGQPQRGWVTIQVGLTQNAVNARGDHRKATAT
jgi:hypothetical protein